MANESIKAAFERMWQHVSSALNNKSDISHNHDDKYYTENEIDSKIFSINESISDTESSITNIINGNTKVGKANNADALDGKHANDFASVGDMHDLALLVGNAPVSEQIATAIEDMNTIDIDFDISNNGEANPINADTLNGKYESNLCVYDSAMLGGTPSNEYVKKSEVNVQINFCVVGGTTEPTNPMQNMIWVNTKNEITDYKFGKYEPENPTNGLVWIAIGENSNISFCTLNVNGMGFDEIYPISAKQYVGGEWVDVAAFIYQNDEWVEWKTSLVVLKDGVLNYGPWEPVNSSQFSNGTINAVANSQQGNSGYLSKKIDTSGRKKLVFRCESNSNNSDLYVGFISEPFTSNSLSYVWGHMVSFVNIPNGTSGTSDYELTLDALTPGEYYFAVAGVATYSIDYIELM